MNVAHKLCSDISKGLIAFADISITTTMIKTSFQLFIAQFFLEGSEIFIRMYYGSVTNKGFRKVGLEGTKNPFQ